MEYLAPLWVWPHVILSRALKVTYAAILHDPVRDFQVGPAWWHRLSVAMGYWPLDAVFVHQRLPEGGMVPSRVKAVEVPHGLYDVSPSAKCPANIRDEWRAKPSDIVFLSFGFIRDNKNVDLLIRALMDNPSAVLVVMGRVQSSTQKPLSYYEDLAADLGVADRVRFRGEFVPDEELGGYFSAADYIALTYNRHFHSQSGVLNVAACARKPILASAGESPLKDCVLRFRLGEFVEPDEPEALSAAMQRLCNAVTGVNPLPEPDWEGYTAYASWDANAKIILETIEQLRGGA